MKRRTLLGSAAMTLGGASVIGTGAFTSVKAERSLSVDVVGDKNAFLQLKANPNCGNGGSSLQSSDFVYTDHGTIGINLTEGITDLNDQVGEDDIKGNGITESSLWRFPNAFKIVNQGTQSVVIDFEVQKDSKRINIGSGGKTKVGGKKRDFSPGDPAVVFYPGSNDAPGNLFSDTDGLILDSHQGQCIGFNVRTYGLSENPFDEAYLKITADASETDSVNKEPQPGLSVSASISSDGSSEDELTVQVEIENNRNDIVNEDNQIDIKEIEVNIPGLDGTVKDIKRSINNGSTKSMSIDKININSLGEGEHEALVTVRSSDQNIAPVSDSVEFNIATAGPTDGLVGYWPLNDISEDTVINAVNGNNGEVNDNVITTDGQVGGAAKFDGTSAISINGLVTRSESVTLAAWARLDGGSPEQEIVSIGDYVGIRGYDDSDNIRGFFYQGEDDSGDGSWDTINPNPGSNPINNEFGHVVYVKDSGNNSVRLYINGDLESTKSSETPIEFSGLGENTFIGKHGDNGERVWNGAIDDVRIYDRALSDDEVASLYEATNNV